jgi:hypothetical protein
MTSAYAANGRSNDHTSGIAAAAATSSMLAIASIHAVWAGRTVQRVVVGTVTSLMSRPSARPGTPKSA